MFRCPGQDMRKLTVSYHPCPKCGKPVEFFSDEMRVRCPHCKTMVHKEQSPSCIQWCKAARDCLGPELYDQIMGKMQEPADKEEE
jgi:DNA-directed RNA polymerase subunit RPC12/RpoP